MQRIYDPVRTAVTQGWPAALVEVLEHGAWDLDTLDRDGFAPLHAAVNGSEPGETEIVELLLGYAADPNVLTADCRRSLAYHIVHEEARDPGDLGRRSAEVVTWLRRGLAKNPEERFQDAGEMAEALRGALG
jgi:ankyrin repeat protein